jgi:hypothetical protein
MSALGQKQTFALQQVMSALPPKADMCVASAYVRFGPIADMTTLRLGVSFSRLEVGGTPFYGAKLLKIASGQLPAMVQKYSSKYSLSQKRTLIEARLGY